MAGGLVPERSDQGATGTKARLWCSGLTAMQSELVKRDGSPESNETVFAIHIPVPAEVFLQVDAIGVGQIDCGADPGKVAVGVVVEFVQTGHQMQFGELVHKRNRTRYVKCGRGWPRQRRLGGRRVGLAQNDTEFGVRLLRRGECFLGEAAGRAEGEREDDRYGRRVARVRESSKVRGVHERTRTSTRHERPTRIFETMLDFAIGRPFAALNSPIWPRPIRARATRRERGVCSHHHHCGGRRRRFPTRRETE